MKTKQQKRQEALARQAKYDSLTVPEKIALCKSRKGNSAKEIARLEKLL